MKYFKFIGKTGRKMEIETAVKKEIMIKAGWQILKEDKPIGKTVAKTAADGTKKRGRKPKQSTDK